MATEITPKTYTIELRDKDFKLKGHLQDYVTGTLQWDWNRVGGCGRCVIAVNGDYLRFMINADDDIRIYLPDESAGSATLWYRGFIQTVTPSISSGKQVIQLECEGYFRWTKRIIVQDSNTKKTYSNQLISDIVDDIVDNFIVANSSITKGTIDTSTFTPDSLEFKTTSREALRTLFELDATVEYGVDANLQFYWRNQNDSVTHKFWVGDKVVVLAEKVDYNGIVNKIYFEGGNVGATPLETTGQSSSSQVKYGLHEAILSNASIVSSGVASKFIQSQFTLRGKPVVQTTVELNHIKKRFEASLPVGAISVIDPDAAQTSAIYGTTGNGGSNKIYGSVADSGSGQLYGGNKKFQFDRVTYVLNPVNGHINAKIQFGNSLNFSRTSATLRRIQLSLDTQRQRDL